jgi:hypothetical protein
MIAAILRFWCRHIHNELMWPVHGTARCRVCLRLHQVDWSNS